MRFSPEFNRLEQQSSLEAAHKKALDLNNRYEIKPDSFTDLYGEQNVANDLAELATIERSIKSNETPDSREMTMWAEVMEALILEQGEQGEWFGDKASTIKTSRYDDVKNGVDMIVEFTEKINTASHAGLAIDASYSNEIKGKAAKIKEKIDSGKLGVIKYFESEEMPLRGELREIPITVITANYKTIQELAELWANNDKKALANHWIQFQILEELIEESKLFSAYATRVGQLLVAQRYDHIKDIAQQILIDKQDTVKDTGQRDKNLPQTLSDIEFILR